MTANAAASPATPPAPGTTAPDLVLRDRHRTEVRLADLWQSAPKALALVFVRHFG